MLSCVNDKGSMLCSACAGESVEFLTVTCGTVRGESEDLGLVKNSRANKDHAIAELRKENEELRKEAILQKGTGPT